MSTSILSFSRGALTIQKNNVSVHFRFIKNLQYAKILIKKYSVEIK